MNGHWLMMSDRPWIALGAIAISLSTEEGCAATSRRSNPVKAFTPITAAATGSAASGSLSPEDDPPGYDPHAAAARHVSGTAPLVRGAPTSQWEQRLALLPRLGDAMPVEPSDRASYELRVRPGGYRLITDGNLLAEVEVSGFRAFTWAKLQGPASAARPRRFDSASGPECGPGQAATMLSATERGVSLDGWTLASAPFVELTGNYDTATCRGKPTQRRNVAAAALWPGVVYAFISSGEAAGEPSELHVVSAAAEWVSAFPVDPKDELRPVDGSFSYVVVPFSERSTASVALALSDVELAHFWRLIPGAPRIPSAIASNPSETRASVRVLIDVDAGRAPGGVVRITVQELQPSSLVYTLLANVSGSHERDHDTSPTL